ncbi:MAG: HAD family hydrolase [Myxococcales bacterium]|nr:HAD family hydrolase [Myxococcales bacterium]
MTLPCIRGVTLDVDGTLYDFRTMMRAGFPGLLFLRRDFFDLFRVRDGMRGLGPLSDFRAEQARRLSELRGISLGEAQALVEDMVDRRWPRVFARVKPFRGLRHVLEELARAGLRLGLVSEYPIEPKLSLLRLADLPFAAKVCCEEVGALKPHPAAFRAAAERMELPTGEILHVGDREDSDVAGARCAGMRAALLGSGRHILSTRADFTFSDWDSFSPIFRMHFQATGVAGHES